MESAVIYTFERNSSETGILYIRIFPFPFPLQFWLVCGDCLTAILKCLWNIWSIYSNTWIFLFSSLVRDKWIWILRLDSSNQLQVLFLVLYYLVHLPEQFSTFLWTRFPKGHRYGNLRSPTSNLDAFGKKGGDTYSNQQEILKGECDSQLERNCLVLGEQVISLGTGGWFTLSFHGERRGKREVMVMALESLDKIQTLLGAGIRMQDSPLDYTYIPLLLNFPSKTSESCNPFYTVTQLQQAVWKGSVQPSF